MYNIDDLIRQGKNELKQCHYEKALELFEKAIELDPNNAEAWHAKVLPLRDLKRYDDALRASDKAIDLSPDVERFWIRKGHILFHLERYEEALKMFDKGIELAPRDWTYLGDKGRVLNSLKRYNEALTVCEEAIELCMDDPHSWKKKGELYEFVAFIIAEIWSIKGFALYYLERYKEALSAWDKSIELYPKDDEDKDRIEEYRRKAKAKIV